MHVEPLSTQSSLRNMTRKLAAVDGPGTAYLTDSLGYGRDGYPGDREEWTEIRPQFSQGETWEDLFARLAAQGCDLLYRVTSRSGRKRLFYREGHQYAHTQRA